MNTCQQSFSLSAITDPCTPDTGPPAPATYSDPQPQALVVTGFSEAMFGDLSGACGAGTAADHWNGQLPVISNPNNVTLKYWPAGLNPGITPHLMQTSSVKPEMAFIAGSYWKFSMDCEGGADMWTGHKLVGLDPTGTYIRVSGASTLQCIHLATKSFDWSPMVWVPTLVQPNGTASASGNGPNFAVSATANAAVTNFGQILGTMLYTGPISGAKVDINVTGVDTGGFSSFRVRVNGNTVTVVPAVGFGSLGITEHYFTIQDPANPGSPLVGATIEVRAIAQTNVPGNSPAFSGVLS